MQIHFDDGAARRWSSFYHELRGATLISMAFIVSACHSGDGGRNPAYPIAGTITGLTAAGLTLQNNGGDNLSSAANATSFQFPTFITAGGRYEVSIVTQPAGMTCTVTHGSGTNLSAAVTDVTVACVPITYPIAGTITGLGATGLILQNNGGADLAVPANAASFQFATQIPSGGNYDVTISAQPSGLTCSLTRGAGVDVGAAVTNISVACNAVTHTIGGAITGLTTSGLVLQNNGGDNFAAVANSTTFQFSVPVAYGAGYNVRVFAQPAGLTCTVSNSVGTNVRADISNVSVMCSTTQLAVGGTVSGLTGNGLVLQNNGGDNLNVPAQASTFEFATLVAYGSGYAITVLTQPAGQICSLSSAVGTATAPVNNVSVICANIITYTLTPSAGANGVISPSVAVVVNSGGSQGFVATPNAGYSVAQWLLDGSLAQSGGDVYTVANITSNHTIAVTFGQATLTPSLTSLVLSVDCPTAGGSCSNSNVALTGSARQMVVTNSGSIAATNVSVMASGLPSGTVISSSTCSGTLPAAASCVITVTPGQLATAGAGGAACSNGIAPTDGEITISSDVASSGTVAVDVLSYGCLYQAGFLYSVDDTTPVTGSIGGKVISLMDQAPAYPNGVVWSSNGAGPDGADASLDLLPGIDEISTPTSGSPTYSSFASFFASTYVNANPFTSSAFSACSGGSDGQCNTANILTFYNEFMTNYGAGSPPYAASAVPTTLSYYAAALCEQVIDGYSDWYLPAICEMNSTSGSCTGTQSVVNDLPSLVGDSSTNCVYGTNCVGGYYWTSTELSGSPQHYAWAVSFSSGGSTSLDIGKNNAFGARCSRVLTFY